MECVAGCESFTNLHFFSFYNPPVERLTFDPEFFWCEGCNNSFEFSKILWFASHTKILRGQIPNDPLSCCMDRVYSNTRLKLSCYPPHWKFKPLMIVKSTCRCQLTGGGIDSGNVVITRSGTGKRRPGYIDCNCLQVCS